MPHEKEQSFEKEQEKLDKQLKLVTRILDDATKSLKTATENSDMLAIKIASEQVDFYRKENG